MVSKEDYFISTSQVSPQNALSYWNDYVGNTLFSVDATTNDKKPNFYGSLTGHKVDGIQLCKINARAHGVHRTKGQIAKSTEGYFLVNFQITGESFISQDGRTVHLKANDWAFTDSTRPYQLSFTTGFELLVLQIPRKHITYGMSYVTANTAKLLDDQGLGKILKRFVYSLSIELKTIDVLTRKYLANNLLQLLNDYLSMKFIKQESGNPSKETMLIQVKSFVDEQITNSQLSVQHIAEIFKCSKRQLHTIFNSEEYTLNSYIRESRLQKSKNDIENRNLCKLTIAEIAYKNGFNDVSHFAKSFKQRFNIPPGEYRILHLQAKNIDDIINFS